jgi:hypothetical protein
MCVETKFQITPSEDESRSETAAAAKQAEASNATQRREKPQRRDLLLEGVSERIGVSRAHRDNLTSTRKDI